MGTKIRGDKMIKVNFFINKDIDYKVIQTIKEAMDNDGNFITKVNYNEETKTKKFDDSDYLILSSIYNIQSAHPKICYIEYGPLIKYDLQYPPIKDATKIWRYFVGDSFNYNFIHNKLGIDDSKIIKSGHPRYDAVIKGTKGKSENNTILYMPTVQISFGEKSHYSTFQQWADDVLYACSELDIKLVIKGHPFLFRYLQPKNFGSYRNVIYTETPNYIDLFNSSKLAIIDGSGIMLEYLHTHKPIILLISDRAKSNPTIREFDKSCYTPTNRNGLIHLISDILNGVDLLKQGREKLLIDNFYNPKGNTGYMIKEYIKTDYNKEKK